MNMIGRPARCDQRKALAARNAAQVSIELDGTGGGDERAALFGAEDTMNEIGDQLRERENRLLHPRHTLH